MPAVDLTISGGLVYTPSGLIAAEVIVNEGRIIAVTTNSHSYQPDLSVDATGKLVLPGSIDMHVHCRDPGYEQKEDWTSVTKCAAAGGVAMIVGMPNTNPTPSTLQSYKEHIGIASKKAVVDFNHWGMPKNIPEIRGMARYGAAGFKFWMRIDEYPFGEETAILDHGEILQTLQTISETGRLCLIHPHDQEIWSSVAGKIKRDKAKTGTEVTNETFRLVGDLSNSIGIATSVLTAEKTGARLVTLHANWKGSINLIRTLKAAGYRFAAETNPIAVAPSFPQRHTKDDIESAWLALNDGTTDIIATDHAPHERRPGGTSSPYLQDYISVIMTGVNKGLLSLERFVKLTSENPAKLLGVYPKKGTISPGSDADLTIIDKNKTEVVKAERNYSKSNWMHPWEGREVQGVPEYTIVRGKIVMEPDRNVVGHPGYGQFTKPTTVRGS